jgi:hypothetical protein
MADTILGNANSTQVLPIGNSQTAAIDFAGDADWWKVTLNAGFGYQVWVEGLASGAGTLADPYLGVYNSLGVFQSGANDISLFNQDSYKSIRPTSTGDFFISAEEYGNNATGTYRITIWQDALDTIDSAFTIPVNSRSGIGHIGWQGDLSDWLQVKLDAGIQYQIDMIGSDGDGTANGLTLTDSYLTLRDSSGVKLLSDDNSGVGYSARIFFTPTSSGNYFLDLQEAGNNASGTYRVIVNASPTSSAMTLGTEKTGSLDFAGDTNFYSLNLTAGVKYAFAVDGTSLANPYLEILNSAGAVLGADDDSGVGLNAFTTYTPGTTGTYYLAARGSGNSEIGAYKAKDGLKN